MAIPFEKIISIIHNARFGGLPTHYPSLAAWNIGWVDILQLWKNYIKKKEDIGIYINIPLCKTKCKFCFLDVIVDRDNIQDLYVETLIKELNLLNSVINKSNKIKSVYIGGGTPNILSEKNLEKLLENIYIFFNLKDCHQISIESNPDFWTETKIKILKKYKVNLVMMGIQSFEHSVAIKNARYQKAINIEKLVKLFKDNGIKLNIDLLLGISDERTFFSDIKKVIKILPHQIHINRFKPLSGNLKRKEKDYLTKLQNKGFEILAENGYLRVDEDSAILNGFNGNMQGNPDFQIYSSIIAAGLMSMGHIYSNVRYQNVYDIETYIKLITCGKLPIMRYCFINEKDEIIHYCLNKILRNKVSIKDLYKKFDKRTVEFVLKKMETMKRRGLISFKNGDYTAFGDINWCEITRSFYSRKYLVKIAKRYRLI